MFVGEGPGEQEDLQGEPFVGRAGQLLTRLIEGIGLTRDDVYIANVVKCRPPGNRDPLPVEIETCRPYLEAQLDFIDADGRRHARQLRHQAPARRPRTGSRSCAASEFPFRDGAVLIPALHPVGGAAQRRRRARPGPRRLRGDQARPRPRRAQPLLDARSCLRRHVARRETDGAARRETALGRSRAAARGDVVVLTGDLGAGKTVLAKGIAAGSG